MLFCPPQMLLLSQDYGKHLLGVEDLLQKHALVEADIGIQADRVKAVNANAQKFAVDEEGKKSSLVFIPSETDSSYFWIIFIAKHPFIQNDMKI